jgi:thioredoxin 1
VSELIAIIPYMLAGVAVAFIGLHFSFWLAAKRLVGHPAADVSDLLGSRLSPEGRTLLYLHSSHCGACHLMASRIDRLARSHPSIVRIDIQQEPQVAKRLGISATPAVIAIENGRIAAALIGVQSERRLRKLVIGPGHAAAAGAGNP